MNFTEGEKPNSSCKNEVERRRRLVDKDGQAQLQTSGAAGLKCTEWGDGGLKFKDDLMKEVSGRINVMRNLNGKEMTR